MPFARHKSLMKPLEPSSRAAARVGPNPLIPAASRSSTLPAQGIFGPYDDKIDVVHAAERDRGNMVRRIDRDTLNLACDAGIAGRAVKAVDECACRHFPGQRVLASAAAQKVKYS
jgi:hypothetical protein